MASFLDRLKKNVAAGFDKEGRDEMRNERTFKRWEKIDKLSEENKAERYNRRQMFSGDKPFSVKEFAKSKLREGKRNAEIHRTENFNRDAIASNIKGGMKSFSEKMEAAEEREEKIRRPIPRRPKAQPRYTSALPRVQNEGFGIDIDEMVYGPRNRQAPPRRKAKQQHKPRDMFDFSHLVDDSLI